MRVDKQSIRHKKIETLCGALDKKCLEHDGYLNYSFLKESEYDYSLPEDENAFVYLVFDEDDNLIAYLGYLKIDSNNMQVCMAVDPDFRRQKIGTNLFLRLVSEFDSCSYQVSLDPNNDIGKAFLEKLGFNFASKEMSMALFKDDFEFNCEPIELQIENDVENSNLKVDDNTNLLKITGLVDKDLEESDEPVKEEIGWLYLISDNNSFCLCDIEIKDEYREKGYGNRLLQSTIKDAFKHSDKIVLHVTSDNTPAINLYNKNKFKTIDTIDCYEL